MKMIFPVVGLCSISAGSRLETKASKPQPMQVLRIFIKLVVLSNGMLRFRWGMIIPPME